MNIPTDLKYTESHEWVRREEDGSLTVGITEYAQDALGDIVFVELPQVGKAFTAGDDAAVVESVKAASDIYAPVSGTVTAVNQPSPTRPTRSTRMPTAPGCSSWPRATLAPTTSCSTPTPTARPPTTDGPRCALPRAHRPAHPLLDPASIGARPFRTLFLS